MTSHVRARISSRPPGVMRKFPKPVPVATVIARCAQLVAIVALVAGAGVLAAAAGGERLDRGAGQHAIALLASCGIAAFLVAALIITRLGPLYRSLARSHAHAEAIPPSRAALQDAYVAPFYAFGAVLLGGVVAGVLIASGSISEADLRARLGAACASIGAALIVAPLFARGIALLCRVWVEGFDAEDAALPGRRGAERMLALYGSSLVLGLSLLATAVVILREAPVPIAIVLALLGLAPAIAVAFVVHARVAALHAEMAALRAEIDAAISRRGAREEGRTLDVECADERLAQLANALETLAADIEESSAKEDLARVAVEELGQTKMKLVASMSHDLRSPLNAILGFCELMRMGHDGELNAAQHESLMLVERSGGELLALLNDILDSARFAAGRLKLHREWTPSVEILTEAVRRGRDLASGKNLDVEAVLEPGLPPLYVDRERIVQAVAGLFRHAARAMDRGTIRMYARVARGREGAPDHVHVDVVDSGGGLREDDRERLFTAFRAVTSASGRRIDGVGLTLSLVRDLAEAHGGTVWFQSEDGKGTRFTVSVPVEGPAPVRR